MVAQTGVGPPRLEASGGRLSIRQRFKRMKELKMNVFGWTEMNENQEFLQIIL